MLRAGLIIGAVAIAMAVCGNLLSPYCVPCLAIFAGLGAGYLTGVFDKAQLPTQSEAVKRGAGGGAIAGAGALLGQIIGGVINAVMVGPSGAADVARALGLGGNFDADMYYPMLALTACCIGAINVALMAGTGALGGLLWWQMTGKNQPGTGVLPPSMPA